MFGNRNTSASKTRRTSRNADSTSASLKRLLIDRQKRTEIYPLTGQYYVYPYKFIFQFKQFSQTTKAPVLENFKDGRTR